MGNQQAVELERRRRRWWGGDGEDRGAPSQEVMVRTMELGVVSERTGSRGSRRTGPARASGPPGAGPGQPARGGGRDDTPRGLLADDGKWWAVV